MHKDSAAPTCVGIIMDGNRRWAREHGLPTLEGHRRGYDKLKEVMTWCRDAGITHLAVYAFSTENWNRSSQEVSYLMDLFRAMSTDVKKQAAEQTAVHFVGDISRFPEDIQDMIHATHAEHPVSPQHHLWIAASYGGRAEIVAGVNALLGQGVKEVDEATFAQTLWTADMPDPDIIIRTGGDKRLSNFLVWAGVYSELFFIDTFWPEFSRAEFDSILREFGERARRFGT